MRNIWSLEGLDDPVMVGELRHYPHGRKVV